MVLQEEFLKGMRRLPGCVNVITTHSKGSPMGCTASAVCSVSASPPSLLVCLNEASQTAWAVQEHKQFCVNICSRDDADISELFAGSDLKDKFSSDLWEETSSGVLRLSSSPAAFECKLSEAVKFGTHFVLIGEITDVHISSSSHDALIYSNGQYGAFSGLGGR